MRTRPASPWRPAPLTPSEASRAVVALRRALSSGPGPRSRTPARPRTCVVRVRPRSASDARVNPRRAASSERPAGGAARPGRAPPARRHAPLPRGRPPRGRCSHRLPELIGPRPSRPVNRLASRSRGTPARRDCKLAHEVAGAHGTLVPARDRPRPAAGEPLRSASSTSCRADAYARSHSERRSRGRGELLGGGPLHRTPRGAWEFRRARRSASGGSDLGPRLRVDGERL